MTYLCKQDSCAIETLGGRLKDLREARHLKQEQVAVILNTNRSTICTYEKDLRQPPYEMLIRLADLYHVSTDYLLGRQIRNHDLADLGKLSPRDVSIVRDIIKAMEDQEKNQ